MAKDHPTGKSGLYSALLELKTPEECYRFLQDVCSYAELSAMEQRYNIAEKLMNKQSYTSIMGNIGASSAIISRVSRVLSRDDSVLRRLLEESTAPADKTEAEELVIMSKAVVFFADGTEECEALLVIDLLRRAKVEVTVASAMGRKELVSSHKIHLTADALAEDVDYSDVDLVVLPGGIPGTPNLAANKTVTETCKAFAAAGKKVAAICAAPSVLASLGLLEGKNATAHAGFQDQLAGAIVHDEEVVVDGNLTTSYGLGGAIPFALELVRQLAGKEEADRIQNAIAYRHSVLG